MEVLRIPYGNGMVPKNKFGAWGSWWYNHTDTGIGGSLISIIGSTAAGLGGLLPCAIALASATGGAAIAYIVFVCVFSFLFLGFLSIGTSMLYTRYHGYTVSHHSRSDYNEMFQNIKRLSKKDRGFIEDLVNNMYACLKAGDARSAEKRISPINTICAELNAIKNKNVVDNTDLESAEHFIEMLREQRKLSA